MNPSPAEKLNIMQASIRCLVFGLLGLLPIIGLPFGLAALWVSRRIRRQESQVWNAAKPYRQIGAVCGSLGTILSSGLLVAVIGRILITVGML
jgi:hypothetical protein